MVSVAEYIMGTLFSFLAGGFGGFLVFWFFYGKLSEKVEIRKIIEETIIYGKQRGALQILNELDQIGIRADLTKRKMKKYNEIKASYFKEAKP